MPRFNVIGIDRESGYDTSLAVEAESKSEAEAEAMRRGVAVTKVRRAKEVKPKPDNRPVEPSPEPAQLIECDDCGRAISRRARNCPTCGAPVSSPLLGRPGEHANPYFALALAIFLGFLFAAIIASMAR